MTGQDPGAATGTTPTGPARCVCGHLAPIHRIVAGRRTGCGGWGCQCASYQPRTVPPPPDNPIDLAGVRQRWAELEAVRRDGGASSSTLLLLALAVASDVPALLAELERAGGAR